MVVKFINKQPEPPTPAQPKAVQEVYTPHFVYLDYTPPVSVFAGWDETGKPMFKHEAKPEVQATPVVSPDITKLEAAMTKAGWEQVLESFGKLWPDVHVTLDLPDAGPQSIAKE